MNPISPFKSTSSILMAQDLPEMAVVEHHMRAHLQLGAPFQPADLDEGACASKPMAAEQLFGHIPLADPDFLSDISTSFIKESVMKSPLNISSFTFHDWFEFEIARLSYLIIESKSLLDANLVSMSQDFLRFFHHTLDLRSALNFFFSFLTDDQAYDSEDLKEKKELCLGNLVEYATFLDEWFTSIKKQTDDNFQDKLAKSAHNARIRARIQETYDFEKGPLLTQFKQFIHIFTQLLNSPQAPLLLNSQICNSLPFSENSSPVFSAQENALAEYVKFIGILYEPLKKHSPAPCESPVNFFELVNCLTKVKKKGLNEKTLLEFRQLLFNQQKIAIEKLKHLQNLLCSAIDSRSKCPDHAANEQVIEDLYQHHLHIQQGFKHLLQIERFFQDIHINAFLPNYQHDGYWIARIFEILEKIKPSIALDLPLAPKTGQALKTSALLESSDQALLPLAFLQESLTQIWSALNEELPFLIDQAQERVSITENDTIESLVEKTNWMPLLFILHHDLGVLLNLDKPRKESLYLQPYTDFIHHLLEHAKKSQAPVSVNSALFQTQDASPLPSPTKEFIPLVPIHDMRRSASEPPLFDPLTPSPDFTASAKKLGKKQGAHVTASPAASSLKSLESLEIKFDKKGSKSRSSSKSDRSSATSAQSLDIGSPLGFLTPSQAMDLMALRNKRVDTIIDYLSNLGIKWIRNSGKGGSHRVFGLKNDPTIRATIPLPHGGHKNLATGTLHNIIFKQLGVKSPAGFEVFEAELKK
jgi:hypothetical protein